MRQFVLTGESTNGNRYTVRGDDFHHIVHVDRMREGDSFPAVDKRGRRFTCTIQAIKHDSCLLSVEPVMENEDRETGTGDPVARLTLFQCVPKGNKLDQIIRQATEAGVAEIVPVQSENSVARIAELPSDRLAAKYSRWERIAREAVKQSGMRGIPVIRKPFMLEEVPSAWKNRGTALFFHQERLDSRGIHDTLAGAHGEIGICVGPEGGFSSTEIAVLRDANFIPIYLGDTVLRTETAAVFAIAAVRTIILERDRWVSKP